MRRRWLLQYPALRLAAAVTRSAKRYVAPLPPVVRAALVELAARLMDEARPRERPTGQEGGNSDPLG